jgi:hypothetical protein
VSLFLGGEEGQGISVSSTTRVMTTGSRLGVEGVSGGLAASVDSVLGLLGRGFLVRFRFLLEVVGVAASTVFAADSGFGYGFTVLSGLAGVLGLAGLLVLAAFFGLAAPADTTQQQLDDLPHPLPCLGQKLEFE